MECTYKPLTAEERERKNAENFNSSPGDFNEVDGYECNICHNKGMIMKAVQISDSYWSTTCYPCKCMKIRTTIRRMHKSGLKDIIKDYTFAKFQATEEWQRKLKDAAIKYADNPSGWFFIGGQSGCVDAYTEYFNGYEWRKISKYNGGYVLQYNPESKKASLTKPKRHIVAPSDVLYQISTKRGSIDQVLSADHNFAYITSKGHMQKKPFSEVMKLHQENVQGFYGRIETAFSYDGGGIGLTDNDIRLMCAVMADGSFSEKHKLCAVNVKKERKKERMRTLLADRDYKEYQKSNGYSEFRFYAPRREKVFSTYWYGCNNRQLGIIADEVFYWDGSIDSKNRRRFFSTIKENADFVQFALAATGTRSTISLDYRKNKACYTVCASGGNSTVSMCSSGGRTKAEIAEYKPIDGKQYCFEVETGYLVLRRFGRIFITGNSGKTHLCTAICREFLLNCKAVKYMLWRDDVVALKGLVNDTDAYKELIDTYKQCEVLYVDDLFKTGKSNDGLKQRPTAADVNIAFEILNYRYNNPNLLTIISSECTVNDIIDIDEATGGRIFERATAFSLKPDVSKNYRLRGVTEL